MANTWGSQYIPVERAQNHLPTTYKVVLLSYKLL